MIKYQIVEDVTLGISPLIKGEIVSVELKERSASVYRGIQHIFTFYFLKEKDKKIFEKHFRLDE